MTTGRINQVNKESSMPQLGIKQYFGSGTSVDYPLWIQRKPCPNGLLMCEECLSLMETISMSETMKPSTSRTTYLFAELYLLVLYNSYHNYFCTDTIRTCVQNCLYTNAKTYREYKKFWNIGMSFAVLQRNGDWLVPKGSRPHTAAELSTPVTLLRSVAARDGYPKPLGTGLYLTIFTDIPIFDQFYWHSDFWPILLTFRFLTNFTDIPIFDYFYLHSDFCLFTDIPIFDHFYWHSDFWPFCPTFRFLTFFSDIPIFDLWDIPIFHSHARTFFIRDVLHEHSDFWYGHIPIICAVTAKMPPRSNGLMTFRFLTSPVCIDVSEDSSADRKTKLTLMLTEPRNVPIVF